MLTAEAILKIQEPEYLFSCPDEVKSEYRGLAKIWHPDHSKDEKAQEVFTHINQLYLAALNRISERIWNGPGLLQIVGLDGIKRRIRYRKKYSFEIGEMLYGDTAITYLVLPDYFDLAENAEDRIKNLNYGNANMKAEVARYLPSILASFEMKDLRLALVLEKKADTFLLRDVLTALGGQLDPKHAAWIISGLLNIACYLEWAGLSHNAISPETVFISPSQHSVHLFGGWWYSAPVGKELKALPYFSHKCAGHKPKKATKDLDLALIKRLGCELLGDETGMSLQAPKPFVNFLRAPSTGSAQEDYTLWINKVLPSSFGARRFVKLDLSASDIFKEN